MSQTQSKLSLLDPITRAVEGAWAKKLIADAKDIRAKPKKPKEGVLKTQAQGRAEITKLNPYTIQLETGFNCRQIDSPENQEHIEELSLSIAENGVREPLTVYVDGDRIVVTDGECRLRATWRAIEVHGAEILSIPVKMEPERASETDRVFSQFLRNSGKRFTTYEQSLLFKKLSDLGWEESDIARRSGMPVARVRFLLDFQHDATPLIHEQVVAGNISVHLAAQTIADANGDAEKAEKVITKAVKLADKTGAPRAMPKHIKAKGGKVRPPLKERLQSVRLLLNEAAPPEDDEVRMSLADFNKIKELLAE